MATYTFDKIEYGGNTYVVSDNGALQLTGGQVTGPVTFGDSVSIDEATLGDLVVNGSASFTNNIQANTINGVTVGSSPKFTDTVTTVTTSGSGNAVTAISASNGAITVTKGSTFLTGITSSQVTTALGYTPYNSTNPNGYTTNTGTVTKVTAGTGLSIGTTAGGNFTTSGTINHTNSVTAQTTQAVYPIKIDAQGHISAYGNAVTIPTVPSNIVNTITTTAGAHTAITSQKGNVSFNVPTKTSHLTNDSGFITSYTDEKLKIEAVSNNTYYPIVGANSTAASVRQYDSTGFSYSVFNGTTSSTGSSTLILGNNIAEGNANNKEGRIKLYSPKNGSAELYMKNTSTSQRLICFPDKSGTVALTSDIPTVPSSTGSATTGITASTTATKTTLGTASSIYGVGSTTTTASKASGANGSASTWAFEEVSIPNVTAAGSASTWAFTGVTVANSISGAVDANDSTQLNITVGTTTVQSKSSGGNGTAPTLGTAIKVQSKKSGTNGTAPSWSFTDVTVPIKNSTATSVPNVSVASATVSITDNGHTHSI